MHANTTHSLSLFSVMAVDAKDATLALRYFDNLKNQVSERLDAL